MTRLALVALALVLAAEVRAESPRQGSFAVRGVTYEPNIDAEFGGTERPYADTFGSRRSWMFRGDYGRALWQGLGTLEVGLGTGLSRRGGRGIDETTNAPTDEETALWIVPVSASVGYRFDWLSLRHGIPLELHAKASLERYHWWVTDGGGTATEKGATNGYSFTAGAGFLLDIVDRGFAREADDDIGVNDTWLVVDVTKSIVDDFGSSKSWDMSDEGLSIGVGLLFVF